MRYCRAKVPSLSRRRQPPRRVPPRFGSRLFSAIRPLLPGGGIDCLRLRLRTSMPGERPPDCCQYRLPSVAARLDTWTRAARLSTLRPLPPTPPFLRALSRSDQWPQYVGGRGLRSLPAVFAGARPARSHSLALTAVDCFPEPLHRGAAVLIGDTPRRTGAFRWLPISFGK